ncbi:hypothetical protein DMENIID0001_101770 [Sergentomyia squamirostris]
MESKPSTSLSSDPEYFGFDIQAGLNYVYPKNTAKYPFREYQYKMCKEAFYRNTLIVLPHGLGKGFIASVVTNNISRWYPLGKVIFITEPKSLLKKHMEACLMSIPKRDCVEITGKKSVSRLDLWKKHRVIFGSSGQVLTDFKEVTGLPFTKIKLLVVMEAHRAHGKANPFAELIEILYQRNKHFRTLAFTSVICKKACEIADVVRNLKISHIEIRHENSPDIAEFVKKNCVKPLSTRFPAQFHDIRGEFLGGIDLYIRDLLDRHLMPCIFTKKQLKSSKRKFEKTSETEKHLNHSEIINKFDICISVHHGLELLEDYGVVSFLSYLDTDFLKDIPRSYSEILKEPISQLRDTFGKCLRLSETEKVELDDELHESIIAGHPKIAVVEKAFKEHFQKNTESRIILFINCPRTTTLIQHCLRRGCPEVQAERLTRDMSEGKRNSARLQFIKGKINTVITSLIPEENIVNEADLIICYDVNASLRTFIETRKASNVGKKCTILVTTTESTEIGLSNLWREKGEIPQDLHRNPIILAALSDQSPRLVPVEFNPVNLIPNAVEGVEKFQVGARARNIADYFESVPRRCLVDSSEAVNFNSTPMAPASVSLNESTVVPLLSQPLKIIAERVNALKQEKFSHLAVEGIEKFETILRGSVLTSYTQEFLLDILRRQQTKKKGQSENEMRFSKFLEKNVIATSSTHKFNYFSSIVKSVVEKLNVEFSAEKIKSDELSQRKETFFDVSHLNTGFHCTQTQDENVNPAKRDGDDTQLVGEGKSICTEETLSFFLTASLEELFERNDPCGLNVFEMRKSPLNEELKGDMKFQRELHDINAQNISDEEEVIPSSQDTFSKLPSFRRRQKHRAVTTVAKAHDDDSSGKKAENPGLQLRSISSPDIDNKFDLGTIDSIFNDDGDIFETMKSPTPFIESMQQHNTIEPKGDEDEPTMEFTSPSVLNGTSRRRQSKVGSARLKHSNNNANDLVRETNSSCISPCEGTTSAAGRSGVDEFSSASSENVEITSPQVIPNSQPTVESFRSFRTSPKPRNRKPPNRFINFEANVVDDDCEEELDEETIRILDTMIAESDEEEIEELNRVNDIQAKYLQSVRSPPTIPGGFRIPQPGKYRNIVDVFSQTEIPDESNYINDTFVVDEVDDDSDSSDIDTLEQAEAILRTRKRSKSNRHGTKAKKSRIIRPTDSD